jgi:hypothetical protein
MKPLRYTVSGGETCQWFTFRWSARRAFKRKQGSALLYWWKRDGRLVLVDKKPTGANEEKGGEG